MKNRLFTILYGMMTSLQLFADRGERGAWDEVNDDSSSVPSWLVILIIAIGYITYKIFDDDKKKGTPKGCIAVIIVYIILFMIVYIINH